MLTTGFKKRIIAAINMQRINYASDVKMSIALGINSSQFSRIKKGELEGVISNVKFRTLLVCGVSVNLSVHHTVTCRAWRMTGNSYEQ